MQESPLSLRRWRFSIGTHHVRQVKIAVLVAAFVAFHRFAEIAVHLVEFLLPGGALLVLTQHLRPGNRSAKPHHIPEDIRVLGA